MKKTKIPENKFYNGDHGFYQLAFILGYQAFENGLEETDNPFEKDYISSENPQLSNKHHYIFYMWRNWLDGYGEASQNANL